MKRSVLALAMGLIAITAMAKTIKTTVFTTSPQMHCENCENKIKGDTTVTSRCMPFGDQEQISDVCVCCGKPAHKLVYWGKAY